MLKTSKLLCKHILNFLSCKICIHDRISKFDTPPQKKNESLSQTLIKITQFSITLRLLLSYIKFQAPTYYSLRPMYSNLTVFSKIVYLTITLNRYWLNGYNTHTTDQHNKFLEFHKFSDKHLLLYIYVYE